MAKPLSAEQEGALLLYYLFVIAPSYNDNSAIIKINYCYSVCMLLDCSIVLRSPRFWPHKLSMPIPLQVEKLLISFIGENQEIGLLSW